VWLKSGTKKQGAFKYYQVASTANEGKIIIWEIVKKPDGTWKLDIAKSYLLALRTRGGKGMLPTGGTAMCSSMEDESVFIAGTESGRLYKCAVPVGLRDQKEKDKKPLNPINFVYEPHTGPVYSVDYSPFHRKLFLSAGCDTHVRLFNILKVSWNSYRLSYLCRKDL
jgi:WD40 repeat protein